MKRSAVFELDFNAKQTRFERADAVDQIGATLIMLITSLAYHALAGIGTFLAAGGAPLFAFGIALSVYQEKLLAIPDQFTNREGVFLVMNWK